MSAPPATRPGAVAVAMNAVLSPETGRSPTAPPALAAPSPRRAPARLDRVRVLEADPELAHALAAEDAAVARRYAVAEVIPVETGTWRPAEDCSGEPGMLGLLILDGLLTRDVVLGGRRCSELLGQGDLLRPWDSGDDLDAPISSESEWCVLEPMRLAVLGRRCAAVLGRWPELTSALLSRTLRRSRGLAIQLAIDHVRRVDVRILLTLWHLADRWGRVGPEGVVVPLRLTHQALANLTGARRPSVTTALSQLVRRGAVRRRPDGSWLLRDDPPSEYLSLGGVAAAGEPGLAAGGMRATGGGEAPAEAGASGAERPQAGEDR